MQTSMSVSQTMVDVLMSVLTLLGPTSVAVVVDMSWMTVRNLVLILMSVSLAPMTVNSCVTTHQGPLAVTVMEGMT